MGFFVNYNFLFIYYDLLLDYEKVCGISDSGFLFVIVIVR